MGLFDRFSKKPKATEQEIKDKNEESEPLDWFWGSFLLNESKFRHQQLDVKRSSKDNPVTLGYIIKELLEIPTSDIGGMTIVKRGEFGNEDAAEEISSSKDVLNYQPFKALLKATKDGDVIPRTGLNIVLIISYRPSNAVFDNIEDNNDKSKLSTDNSIIMYLRGMGPFIYETAYMRVSVMIPNFTDTDDFRTTQSKNAPFTTSFILGYDMIAPDKKLTKYDQLEASLIKKSNSNEELTSEETSILEGMTYSKDLGHDFGYGRWLVSERRYADALLPLMKTYNFLKTRIVTDWEKLQHIFEETCFNIGFCFNELEQYDRATYYLELIQPSDNDKYVIEYINSLVNNRSPRALKIVQHYISLFNSGKRIVDSEESYMFYDFLGRRLAYLFVEYDMWDNAKSILSKLKESPASHDFAVSELEYIDQKLNNQ